MKQENTPRRNSLGGKPWKAVLGLVLLGVAMASPQVAFADDKKDKGKDVPIVVGKPIITDDGKTKK